MKIDKLQCKLLDIEFDSQFGNSMLVELDDLKDIGTSGAGSEESGSGFVAPDPSELWTDMGTLLEGD